MCVSGELHVYVSKEEFARQLNSAGSDEVSELRVALFEEAVCRDLVDDGDCSGEKDDSLVPRLLPVQKTWVQGSRMKCGRKTVKGMCGLWCALY